LAGRTPYEAAENFLGPLKRCVSHFTGDQLELSAGGRHPADEPHSVALNRGQLSRLRSDPPLALLLSINYKIVEAEGDRGPWRTTTTKYEYAIHKWKDPQRELIAFHWHPSDRVDWPHVHLKWEILREDAPLPRRKLRIRTHRVSIENVFQMLVSEMGCEPISTRDWETTLAETEARFRQYQSWGAEPPPPD
jgi:hypothetical protein